MKNYIFPLLFSFFFFISAHLASAQVGFQTNPVTYEKPLDSALVQILRLAPQQYISHSKGVATTNTYGFQTEEFETVFPFMVTTKVQLIKADHFAKNEFSKKIVIKTIDYVALVPALVAAMQEQQAMILKQQQQIDALQKLIHLK